MIWLSLYVCCCILMLMIQLFNANNGHITRKGKALKEIVFCVRVHRGTRTCSPGPTSLPLCLGFFFSSFFFILLHFSILDNTPRIDIKQKWIINRGQEWASFQSRERVKSEGIFKKDGKTDRRGALLSRGFSEPYVGAHRLMGRLVPGLPGILYAHFHPPTPPKQNTRTHT